MISTLTYMVASLLLWEDADRALPALLSSGDNLSRVSYPWRHNFLSLLKAEEEWSCSRKELLSVDEMFSGHKRRLFSDWVEFSTLIKTKSVPVKLFTRSLWNLNPPPSFTTAESLMSELTEKGSGQLLPLVYRHLICYDLSGLFYFHLSQTWFTATGPDTIVRLQTILLGAYFSFLRQRKWIRFTFKYDDPTWMA